MDDEDDELIPPDVRRPRSLLDSRRQADGELSDSDDEGEGGRRNHAQHRDHDRESPGSRKFGILGSGSAASLGAGPSGLTTAARVISTSAARPSEMDVDTPAPSENGVEKVNGVHGKPDEMVVDTPAVAA